MNKCIDGFLQSPLDRKWTIGFVNYFSSVYLKWQLKLLYRCCDPSSFQIILVNNSDSEDGDLLRRVALKYRAHRNIAIIPNRCSFKRSSEQHGEGLNKVMEWAQASQFVLIQDPDFFWVGKNYLSEMETALSRGAVAFGAPYIGPVGIGASDFPSAFGCAYNVEKIRGLDFMPDFNPEVVSKYEALYPQEKFPNFVSDVGYKIRQACSCYPYVSLEGRPFRSLGLTHSYIAIVQEYLRCGQTFGFHLFRGCATGIPTDACDPRRIDAQRETEKARNIYGFFFYLFAVSKPIAKVYAEWIGLTRSENFRRHRFNKINLSIRNTIGHVSKTA